MATYTKGLTTIKVYTIGGNEFTATDVEKQSIASDALAGFKQGKLMHIFDDPKDYIPFKAVDHIEVTVETGSFEKADAYCKDESAALITDSGKTCTSEVGC